MKKILFISLASCLILLAGCSKNSSVSGGSWTFRSQTYSSTFSNWIRGDFTSYTGTNLPTGSVAFRFHQDPDANNPKSGVYTATNMIFGINPPRPDSGFVFITFTDTSATHAYYPTNSANTQITVTKSPLGKLSITIPPVMMFRAGGAPGDSALLQGTIVQTP